LRKFYYTLLAICFVSGLTLFTGVPIGQAESMHDDDDDPETTEIVVKLNPVGEANIAAINAAYGTTTIEVLVGSAGIYRLRVPAGGIADSIANRMTEDARILYAEPNYSSEAPEGNPRHIGAWGGADETGTDAQYAINLLGLADAHRFRRGQGVVVAVLDTGVQLDHPDLTGSWTEARYDFVDDDADPTDIADNQDNDGDGHTDEAFGHGTHISGILHLTAPDARIMPLRVLEADGYGNIFVIAEAIQFAVANGADIISLSLGSVQESQLMEDILKDVVEQTDVVVVAAAGNMSNNAEQFPASEEEVLAVTSIDVNSRKSDFANYGEWIDIAAPGEAILSAFPVSDQATWSGTSMAVPFVSGPAALIRSAVPAMKAAEVTAYIRASAQSLDSLNPQFEGELGAGRVNIGGSIRALCNEDGTCSAPNLSGAIVLESSAVVNSRPTDGLVGTWIVGDHVFVADADTEFREEDGALAVGTCADIEYLNTSPYTALEIRSRARDDCPTLPVIPPSDQLLFLPVIAR
jgi:thermitase